MIKGLKPTIKRIIISQLNGYDQVYGINDG